MVGALASKPKLDTAKEASSKQDTIKALIKTDRGQRLRITNTIMEQDVAKCLSYLRV